MRPNASPKDRTKREHVAQYKRTLWANDDKTFLHPGHPG